MSELSVDLLPTPGFVHVVLAVWVPEKGWLTSIPAVGHPYEGPLDEKVAFKAKLGARAIMHAFEKEEAKENPQLPLPMASYGNSCPDCGGMMIPTGSCEACSSCGTSGGCS